MAAFRTALVVGCCLLLPVHGSGWRRWLFGSLFDGGGSPRFGFPMGSEADSHESDVRSCFRQHGVKLSSSAGGAFHRSSVPLSSEVDAVEASALSAADFDERYASQNLPVLIKGGCRHMPAFKRWGSPSYLQDKVGPDLRVRIETSRTGNYGFEDETWSDHQGSYAAYIATLHVDVDVEGGQQAVLVNDEEAFKADGSAGVPKQVSATHGVSDGKKPAANAAVQRRRGGSYVATILPTALAGDVLVPSVLVPPLRSKSSPSSSSPSSSSPSSSSPSSPSSSSSSSSSPSSSSSSSPPSAAAAAARIDAIEAQAAEVLLWHGSGGQNSLLHSDRWDNMFMVLRGRKELTIFDPLQGHLLRENRDMLDKTSPVDIDAEPGHPSAPLPGATPLRVVVEAGDVLYLPLLWWHQVVTPVPGLAVSYWFDRHGLKGVFGLNRGDGFGGEEIINALWAAKALKGERSIEASSCEAVQDIAVDEVSSQQPSLADLKGCQGRKGICLFET